MIFLHFLSTWISEQGSSTVVPRWWMIWSSWGHGIGNTAYPLLLVFYLKLFAGEWPYLSSFPQKERKKERKCIDWGSKGQVAFHTMGPTVEHAHLHCQAIPCPPRIHDYYISRTCKDKANTCVTHSHVVPVQCRKYKWVALHKIYLAWVSIIHPIPTLGPLYMMGQKRDSHTTHLAACI